MNQRVAKKLRKICNPIDPVSKRVYRRLKRQYTRVPHHAKRDSFWIKSKSNGRQYLSGEIIIDGKKVPCLMFKNDYQEGNTPHFHIYSVGE